MVKIFDLISIIECQLSSFLFAQERKNGGVRWQVGGKTEPTKKWKEGTKMQRTRNIDATISKREERSRNSLVFVIVVLSFSEFSLSVVNVSFKNDLHFVVIFLVLGFTVTIKKLEKK